MSGQKILIFGMICSLFSAYLLPSSSVYLLPGCFPFTCFSSSRVFCLIANSLILFRSPCNLASRHSHSHCHSVPNLICFWPCFLFSPSCLMYLCSIIWLSHVPVLTLNWIKRCWPHQLWVVHQNTRADNNNKCKSTIIYFILFMN